MPLRASPFGKARPESRLLFTPPPPLPTGRLEVIGGSQARIQRMRSGRTERLWSGAFLACSQPLAGALAEGDGSRSGHQDLLPGLQAASSRTARQACSGPDLLTQRHGQGRGAHPPTRDLDRVLQACGTHGFDKW